MKKKNIPLNLVSLQVSIHDADSLIAITFAGQSLFDNRSDFAITPTQSVLAVLLQFSNLRMLHQSAPSGIRRPVSVSLIDTEDKHVVCSSTLTVRMKRNERECVVRTHLPMDFNDIDLEHSYKVCVCDVKSGRMLARRNIRLFDVSRWGESVTDCFMPLQGGLIKCDGTAFYKALRVQNHGYFKVEFCLNVHFAETPLEMPEMEIRLHYANGLVDSRFGTLEVLDDDEELFQIDVSFHADQSRKGIGYAELRCMDEVVAGFAFSTNADEKQKAWNFDELTSFRDLSPEAAMKRFKTQTLSSEKETADDSYDEFDKLLDEFLETRHHPDVDEEDDLIDDSGSDRVTAEPNATETASYELTLSRMTGLSSVKAKLATFENVVKFNRMRLNNHLSSTMLPLHAMFLGSPGTGKTTVAKQMGRILREAGLLSKGHVVEKQRANLLGPNYSNEESNTLEAIEEAQGGILFIDEAYQLYQPEDPRDPGRLVIETLMTALADESRRDWMLILAGYPDEMKRMFNMNPGLKSRIPNSNIYVFEDFTIPELMEIAENYLQGNNYRLSPEAHKALERLFSADYKHRDKKFGNARYVINQIQTEILPAMANRVVAEKLISKESLSLIMACDIPTPKEGSKPCRQIGFHL